ncbi:MAG: hypothetical protein OEW37_00495 [Rhodospirillaceae bacterium]|nr:hypothetical protein [Rhodospirillaceae bacterium]
MQAGRETKDLRFAVQHIGFEADFYHPLGKGLTLSENVVSAFEDEKDDAEIFIQTASNTHFSSDEILSWFLLQTNTSLDGHIPPDALERGGGDIFVTFPIRFDEGVFHMETLQGNVALRALSLLVKVSIVRKNAEHND